MYSCWNCKVVKWMFILLLLDIRHVCESKTISGKEVISIPECHAKTFKVIGHNRVVVRCDACPSCPPGQQPSVPCGSLISEKDAREVSCSACPNGTFSISYSRSSCRRCSKCKRRSKLLHKCTATKNTVCMQETKCNMGYYSSLIPLACLPCSRCCGDENDIKIKECASQGSNNDNLCSVHSIHRCSYSKTETRTKLETPSRSSNRTTKLKKQEMNHSLNQTELYNIISILIAFVFITFILFFTWNKFIDKSTSENIKVKCFPTRLSKKKSISDTCKGDQSDELEDWSNNDVIYGIYSFKSGVSIKYDKNIKEDRDKDLVVEVLNDEYVDCNFRNVEPDQIFLSPIFRFYSQGEKFVEKVKVSLPHSALLISDQKNYWDIEILCMDERIGKKAKWKKVDDDVDVNWKDASFDCNTLLTYAVVGKPRQGAKKRMQIVVFTMKDMISDLFEVALYLLDDNESSFDRVLKENKTRGFAMIGSLYATFIDCHTPLDISVSVKGLLDGWELNHLSPKTISNRLCANSYFNIPSFQAVFRRVKRREEKFNCKFTIKVGGNQSDIIIPVFTFVPEEELCVFVDVHEEDRSVLNEKTSLFKDMPYDIQYQVSRMLDVSAKGQGKWRQVGQYFGLTENLEEFSKEYATLDGSPTKALFEYLYASQPNITVGEFAKCLEGLGREDVLSLLYKHRKKI